MAGSGSRKTLADQLRDSLSFNEEKSDNKPDFRELDLGPGSGSPVSPLRTRITGLNSTTTSSSSSSSGSVSGRYSGLRKSDSGHSGELKPGHDVNVSGQRKSGSGRSGELKSGHGVNISGQRKSGSGHSGELKPGHGVNVLGQRKSGSGHSGECSGGLKPGHGRSNSGGGSPVTSPGVNVSGQRKSGSGHSGEFSGGLKLGHGRSYSGGGSSVASPGVNVSGQRKSGSGHPGEFSGGLKPGHGRSYSGGGSSVTSPGVNVSGQRKSGSGHSGEYSGGSKTGHGRFDYSGGGGGSATSPSVNVLPGGNICPSGKILKTGMASKPVSDVLGTGGMGTYGHGNIMRGGFSLKSGGVGVSGGLSRGGSVGRSVSPKGSIRRGDLRNDPEELKRIGNENYKKGNFGEALSLYDKAIAISPGNAVLHCNRAAALIGLQRLGEAVRECEEAIRFDPSYVRPHQRLGSLLLRLGQVENARRHFFSLRQKPDQAELQKLEAVEKHISKCTGARKLGDWTTTLKESEAATSSGADTSPQLFACKAEASLKLQRLEDAEKCISKIQKYELSPAERQLNFFGMFSEAYILSVQAQIEMALGRFGNALTAIEKAAQIDPRSAEVCLLLKNMRLVVQARDRGNDLFRSERYTEACAAYGEGLMRDSSNSFLYFNRAACWYKLGQWEKSLDDCNQALHIQPYFTKALLCRAASNTKLERWAEAVRDYEVLRRELPNDKEVAESLSHAQAALMKTRGEDVHNMKVDGEVKLVSGLEQFQAAISSSGVYVVHFKAASNLQCKQISPFLDALSTKFPSINFLKVDVEESPAIATAESIRTVPTFKIYKNGNCVMLMVSPNPEVLESSVKQYST